ncbi:glycosyltransferase [Apibacter muscae]|uniref:Glycosyltransferase n=1 Tax=Apibacter muscae TaxID=2509004 RepID=A0A563DGX6_9FLAO|nr:glycosyltransferase [Apibacter muscae]TWP29281.1 glycosyltransferase [Apibacter muscae]TWP31095.1 glycosyltransferase [Apibacter muscae]
MIKLLFVNTDLRGGGAEKVLVNLLNRLDFTKYEVTLFTVFKEGVNRENLRPEVKQKWFFNNLFKGYSRIALIFPPRILFKFFIKEKYDIIISYLEGFPSRIVSGCEDPNTKIVSWIHLELYKNTVSYEFRNLKEAEKTYNKFDKIVCVAESVKKCLQESINIRPNKFKVIYNSLDIEDIIHKSKENVLPIKNKLRLCTVGRLNPQKGYDRLLRIVSRLKNEDNIDFELLILGTGPLENELKKYVKENKLIDTVQFLGYNKNPYAYIKSSDLFVCSSYKEGYSTVVTESIVLGTPVISTNCSGMSEILDEGRCGVIVNNDEESLYLGLKNILLNNQLIEHYKEKAIERSLFLKERNELQNFDHLISELIN